ncbi:hypothetical protein VNI00_000915 [Paramarasmius palmivorus]|uniref:Uncharacterized protein n=1 Tax=Paramarasmius palmivorus TaxID=297713 RepID=A0AAW0E8Q8_9AGAR
MSCVHFRSPLRFEVDLATNELVEVNCVLLNKPTSDRRTFDGFIPEAYLPLISSVLAFAPIAYIKLLSATLSKTPYRLARMVVYLLNRYMAIKFILELQRLVTQIQALHGS